MEFFSGLKKAYDRIETEMSKSLNFTGNESQNDEEDLGNSKSEHGSQSNCDPRSEQSKTESTDTWGQWDEDQDPSLPAPSTSTPKRKTNRSQKSSEPKVPSRQSSHVVKDTASPSPTTASSGEEQVNREAVKVKQPQVVTPPPQQVVTPPPKQVLTPPPKQVSTPPSQQADTSKDNTSTPKGTPVRSSGKTQLENLSKEDLIKYVKKQAQMMQKLKTRNEELTKEHSAQVPEAKPSSPSETEALLEELQVLKSQNDKNIEEQRQIKQMCTQLKNERDELSCQVESLNTKLLCTQQMLEQEKNTSCDTIEELSMELTEAKKRCQELSERVAEKTDELQEGGDSEEVERLRLKLEEVESNCRELKETSKKRELELKKHLKRLTTTLDDVKSRNQTLQEELTKSKECFEEKENKNEALLKELELLQQEVKSVREDRATAVKDLQRLSQQEGVLSAAQEELKDLKETLAEKTVREGELQETVEEQRRLLKELRDKHEKTVSQLNDEQGKEEVDGDEELAVLQSSLVVKDNEICQLKEDLEQRVRELTQARKQLQEAQEESTSRLDENSHMTAEIQEVTDKLSELEEALRLKTAEIETLRVEHDEELLRLRQGLEKEAGLKANVEEENKVLREELTVLNEEKEKLAQVREALEGEEDERREQNEQLLVAKEDEVKLLSDKIASLSEQLSLTEKKLEEAQEESTSRLDENSHMTAEIQEVTGKLSELEEALMLKTAEIETLRVEHDEELLRLRQGLEKEAGLKANVEEENKVLREELTVLNEEKEKLAQVREALEGKEDERREQNEQLLVAKEDEVKLLSDKIASLSEQLSLTEKKLETACAECQETQETSLTLSAELSEVKSALSQKEQEVANYASTTEDLKNELLASKKKLEDSTSEHKGKYAELTEKCENLQSKLTKLNLTYEDVAVKLEEKTCRVTELEDVVGRLQANFDKAKDQLSETQEKLVKSEKGVKASNLIDLEIADYQHTVKGLEAKVTVKDKELEEVKSSLRLQQDSSIELKRSLGEAKEAKSKTEEKMAKMKGLLVKTRNELTESRKKEVEQERAMSELRAQIEEERLAGEEAKVQVADLVMKMEVSSQQHQLSTESLQSSLRRQEGRTRSLQEDLAAVKETLRARDEEFENYKVRAQSVLKQKTVGPNSKDIETEMRQSYETQISGLQQDLHTSSDRLTSALADLEDLSEEHSQLAKRHEQLLEEYQDARDQWKKKWEELVSHHKTAEGEKEELVTQLRQEIQHISQAYKEQMTSIQKEHRLIVEGLKDRLQTTQNELVSMQQQQQQQQQQQEGTPSREVGIKRTTSIPKSLTGEHSDTENKEHSLPHHSHINSLSSETGTRQQSAAGTPLLSLEKLLNTDITQTSAPLSPVVSQMSDSDVRQQLMAAGKKIEHLTEVLGESEATSMRLSDQAKLLKEEIRRLERNKEREESISNMEYLKNVVLKFLHSEKEQEQLLPVITNLLKLSQQEKAYLEEIIKGNNPGPPELAIGENPHLHGNKEKGWSSYIHRWTGY